MSPMVHPTPVNPNAHRPTAIAAMPKRLTSFCGWPDVSGNEDDLWYYDRCSQRGSLPYSVSFGPCELQYRVDRAYTRFPVGLRHVINADLNAEIPAVLAVAQELHFTKRCGINDGITAERNSHGLAGVDSESGCRAELF
ncbi:hypothetical protein PsorP6_017407 [Peronosclerospora sorghi]|uniref:Uncharacterized protein n=1 Tax=Peronosclerospora sorghi TaxID=230839 RepID=A0ACC0WMB5_9STRA|nr:hypothetical protein PsorP6_017407 [Peronosclerospora sorghi]